MCGGQKCSRYALARAQLDNNTLRNRELLQQGPWERYDSGCAELAGDRDWGYHDKTRDPGRLARSRGAGCMVWFRVMPPRARRMRSGCGARSARHWAIRRSRPFTLPRPCPCTLRRQWPRFGRASTTTTIAGMGCDALLVPGVNPTSGDVNHYYNAAAFTNPASATTIGQTDLTPLGGSPTQVRGPGFISKNTLTRYGANFRSHQKSIMV